MAYLGSSFSEATDLHGQHLEVVKALRDRQSPVEELLRQADDMVANRKQPAKVRQIQLNTIFMVTLFFLIFPKAEVYAAMAESLGTAWRDLNSLLETRRAMLEQNYLFQGHLVLVTQSESLFQYVS